MLVVCSSAENDKYLRSGTCGENLTWTLDVSTGELKITGTGDIHEYAFTGNDIADIIKSVVIEDGVESIGAFAFTQCTNLASVTIPDSVRSINIWAFEGCTGLTSITIPNGVTKIAHRAFGGCTSLANITIPDSVTSINKAAFYDTAYFNNYSNWENGVLYIGNHLINAKFSVSGAYAIKNETKGVADYAFCDCYNLTSITIPESVDSIGYKALGYYYSHSADDYVRIDNFTVVGCRNSAAETYANENGFTFIALDEEHSHTFGGPIICQPTCTKNGNKTFTCVQCSYSYTEVILATGHTDADNDGKCDTCGNSVVIPSDPSATCSHICHKGGISKFFYKIALFFWKLFKTHKECSCGALHY